MSQVSEQSPVDTTDFSILMESLIFRRARGKVHAMDLVIISG